MFAVIKTGGKQYRVTADDVLKIAKLEAQAGEMVEFGEVLAHGDGDDAVFGVPMVEGARVTAEVVSQGRTRTIIAFKKRRRQNSRRKRGQRQHETTVRILEILAAGQQPSRKPEPASAKATVDVTATTDQTLQAQAPAPAAKEALAKAKPKTTVDVTATTDQALEAQVPAAANEASTGTGEQVSGRIAPLFSAPSDEPDDLVVIKGIGPVAARQLKDEGITTFAQLAALTEDEVATIDAHMPFSTAQIEDWREQAKALAKR